MRETSAANDVRRTDRRRRVLFRVLAVCLGLSPLVVAESVLWAFGVGAPASAGDPFIGFAEVEPLFVLDAKRGVYTTATSRLPCFQSQSFPAKKPPGTLRIVCFGGSTVQGRPYAVETSFTSWLALSLRAADPSREWEVINCGGTSYASYRLAPIVEEMLTHEPDLLVLMTGQNEFLEARTYPKLTNLPGPVRATLGIAGSLKTFGLVRKALEPLVGDPADQLNQDRPILPVEVDALLDYKGGLETYHRDDAWRDGVIAHFALNVRRMIAAASNAGVPIVLVNEAANLQTPPFKSEHRPGLSLAEQQAFEARWNEARTWYGRSLPAAAAALKGAIAVDDEHAGIWYALGACQQDLGQVNNARASLARARDLDICPLRITSTMQALVVAIAKETRTPLVDAEDLLAARSKGGITGNDWMLDHVHPSIAGHQLIAAALVDEMVRRGWTHAPRPGWDAERERLYAERLATLDPAYYFKGEQRLRNLEAWAAGRCTRLRSDGTIAQEFLEAHRAGAAAAAAAAEPRPGG